MPDERTASAISITSVDLGVPPTGVKAASAWPPLSPFGITRVGDLTDLDVIGLPVWFATRPNARALSVSQGKGLTHEQARISAVMESIEGAVAEQTRGLVSEFGSLARMTGEGQRLVSLRGLVRCRSALLDPDRERAWVRGVDYTTGADILAPYELVGMDMRVNFPWDSRAFHVSSVGLAAGPDFAFAASRALLEAIEHDAVSLVQTLGLQGCLVQQLRHEAGVHSGLDEAVKKICAAGLEPRLFNLTNRLGVPAVAAVIKRPVLHADGSGERLSGGYACRLDPCEAALAALLEAVQSRLTNIAGSRDDMDPSQYEAGGNFIAPLASGAVTLSEFAAAHRPVSGLSSIEVLEELVSRLAVAGQRQIAFFDLPCPVRGIHVVRTLVPGLRTCVEGELMQIGMADLMAANVPSPNGGMSP
jgi:ribosomal protein S12 methylthiotransferase accessory factor